jgi:thimet oligopeptidase
MRSTFLRAGSSRPGFTLRLAPWLLAAGLGTAQAAPTLPGPAFPVYTSAAQVEAACTRGLATTRERIAQLERRKPGAGWLAAYDALSAHIEDAAGPFYLLSNVHPDKAVREATEACELRWQDVLSSLGQNPRLYAAAKAVQPRDSLDRHFRQLTLEGFEDSGVGLPEAPRARAKAITDRITALSQTFDKNIRDGAVKLAFTEAELLGVPEGVWKTAPRDAQGRVLLGLDYPSYVPVVQGARDGAARERMWRAKTNEGGPENLKLLAEITTLRKEYAGLFGAASYADFTLRRRMAQSTAQAQRFLAEVQQAVAAREKQEVEELRAAKARELGTPLADTRLERWDASYYTEQLKRERYSVDQQAFRPYFPPEESLALVMRIVEKTMGVRYTRVPGVTLWHPEVQAYAVSDTATGRPLATLYVDLYPREGKYNHAAVWSFRNGSTLTKRAPQAALVVNFDRQGLTLDEFETLLHEFGHAVHNNLSATRYASLAGTSTLRDFVEAPSQMLEEWVFDRRVLDLMKEVCARCKPVPDELLKQARVAKRYGQGLQYARQNLYASFDLELHAATAPEPMALWARMEGATPLGHVPGTMFPAGFSHVAGGYAAGYYGYLWSEVLAADLRTAFGNDKLDAKVGRRYRDTVLANGGQRPPQELVTEFLGRPSSTAAFFDELRR